MDKRALRAALSVYFVIGSAHCGGRPLLEVVEAALRGGVTMVQFREKDSSLPLRETVALGRAVRERCRQCGVPFIVNDRVDLALLLDADGVHVGQDDLPPSEVRKLLGPGRIVGMSVGTPEELDVALREGPDYLGVGPVYETVSKADAGEAVGTEFVAYVRSRTDLPLVGIGGITPENAAPVIAAGSDGVAVVSAIGGASDPEAAAQALAREVNAQKAACGREDAS